MAEIVNLRMARKAKARNVAEDTAAANRAKFGRSKSDRATARADSARVERTLDDAKRDA